MDAPPPPPPPPATVKIEQIPSENGDHCPSAAATSAAITKGNDERTTFVSAAAPEGLSKPEGGETKHGEEDCSSLRIRRISSCEELLSDAFVMSTVFEHCAHYPPHGPYAYLTAISLAQVLLVRHCIEISPVILVAMFSTFFKTDHLREWPSLYVAAELRGTDVDAL